MAKTRIYLDLDMTQWQTGHCVDLPKEAVHHLNVVLRKKSHDPIQLFDGKGNEWAATLINASKREAQATLLHPVTPAAESPITTHLGIALFRSDRFDFALQKAVELGINVITPLITENVSIKQSSSHLAKRMTHWQKVIESACEQSRRASLPELRAIQSFEQWMSQRGEDKTFILHPPAESEEQKGAMQRINDVVGSGDERQIAFASGPEGGFTDSEVELALQKSAHAIAMGPRILRAETAPLTFLAVIQALKGDV